MNKILLLLLVLIFNKSNWSFAQEVEINFNFDDKFPFLTKLDRIEGQFNGNPSRFCFFNDKLIIFHNIANNVYSYDFLAKKLQLIQNGIYSGYRIFFNRILYGSNDKRFGLSALNIAPKETTHYKILTNPIKRVVGLIPYWSDKMLFLKDSDDNLVTFEIKTDNTLFYRDAKQTTEWLKKYGDKFGYRKDEYGVIYFGELQLQDVPPYFDQISQSLIFYDKYDMKNTRETRRKYLSNYIGKDKQGLSYFINFTPSIYDKDFLQGKIDVAITYGIVDPWTKKVVFRTFAPGIWTPPRNPENEGYLLISNHQTIHPEGDIYYLDADVKKEEYQIKKIKNDWWKEFGIENRIVGRINANQVPLYADQTKKTILTYNFENEYVLILENKKNSNEQELIKVRKMSGKEGWILKSYIYFE